MTHQRGNTIQEDAQFENQEPSREKAEKRSVRDFEKENTRIFEEQLDELEQRDNQEEITYFFVKNVLESSGTTEKIYEMERRGLLQKVLPELGVLEEFPVNPRDYEKKDAKKQSLYLLEQVENGVDLENYHFPEIKNAKALLKLAALLSRIGIPDAVVSPESPNKYYAYEKKGSKKAEDVIRRMNQTSEKLEQEEYFSEKDIVLIQTLIENHKTLQRNMMKPVKYSWESEKNKRVKDWTKTVYSTQLLNERIDFEETIELANILGHAELLTLKGGAYKKEAVKRYSEFEDNLAENVEEYKHLQEERRIKYFIDGEDIQILGIYDGRQIKELLETVRKKQVDHEIESRRQALEYVYKNAASEDVPDDIFERILNRKRKIRYRMENMRSIDTEKRDGYILRKYRAEPVKQFGEQVSKEELKSTLYNGNYPSLVFYLESKTSSNPENILEKLLLKGFVNLDQIEEIVRRHPEYSIEETEKVFAPFARHTEITRDNGMRVVLENGFQGRDHQGTGKTHISFQRSKALVKYFEGKDIEAEYETGQETSFTRENAKQMNTLEAKISIEVKDIEELLDKLREITQRDLAPRSDRLHITIVGPEERSALKDISLSRTQKVKKQIRSIQKKPLKIRGVGYIDGSDPEGSAGIKNAAILPKDISKATAFLSVESEELQEVRKILGLPEKDLHITLGFEGADIYKIKKLDKNGDPKQDPSGKDQLDFVPKKESPKLSGLESIIPSEIVLQKIQGKRRKKKRLETPEIIEKIDEQFFEDGVIKTAGNPDIEIINARKAKEGSKIAIRRIDNTRTPQYCGVILLNIEEQKQTIVTSLFYRDKKDLRAGVKLFLRQIHKAKDINEGVFEQQLDSINSYFEKEEIGELTGREVQEAQLEKNAQIKEHTKGQVSQEMIDFFKKKGLAQKQMGRIIGIIEAQKRKGAVKDNKEAMQKLEDINGHQMQDYINALQK